MDCLHNLESLQFLLNRDLSNILEDSFLETVVPAKFDHILASAIFGPPICSCIGIDGDDADEFLLQTVPIYEILGDQVALRIEVFDLLWRYIFPLLELENIFLAVNYLEPSICGPKANVSRV